MVCLLHTLGQGGILASCAEGSVQYYIFWFLEISSYCAVNGFAIISGYTAVERPQKYSKLINMWFQAFFYSFIVTVILALFGFAEGMGTEQYVRMALPLTHNMFWYFTAYFALFLVTPLLHKVMELFDEKGSRKALLVLILVFSCVNFRHNAFASGYSAMWVMILYCVGALAKKGRLFERKKSYALILTFALCVILSWGGKVFFRIDWFVSYTSPTIVLCGLALVILFLRFRPKGTVIRKLTPLLFGVYLFQLNYVIWTYILKGAFAFIADMNAALGILCVIGLSLAIFLSGLLVELIRIQLAKLLRIPVLCEKLATLIDQLLIKFSKLLE